MEPKTLRIHPYNKYVEIRYIEVMPDVVIRGIYARRSIPKGTKVEECPVVPVYDGEPWQEIRAVYSYTYEWVIENKEDDPITIVAIPLGVGGVFNHSSDENLHHECHVLQFFMEFFTNRDIKKGEELTINYGWSDDGEDDERYSFIDEFHRPLSAEEIEERKRNGDWNEKDDAKRHMGWEEFTNV